MATPNVTCHHCGKAYHMSPSKVAKNATGRFFCQRACLRAWQATTKVEIECAECGKKLVRYKHYTDQHELIFCNQRCRGRWMSKHNRGEAHPNWTDSLTKICDRCGKEFRQKSNKAKRNRHNFCSMECSAKWIGISKRGKDNPSYKDPIVKPCDNCGKTIERKPSRIGKTQRTRHFCSEKCKREFQSKHYSGQNSPTWKGGAAKYYGPNWNRQARAARKRDGYKCQCCGVDQEKLTRKLDVHHIVPFRSFGYAPEENDNYKRANTLSNLISLCADCHHKIERGNLSLQLPLLGGD